MAITTTTHLNFRGDARDALGFYQSVFGGHLAAVTYADARNVSEPAEAHQLMWGQVTSDAGFRVMAYDVPSSTPYDAGTIPVFVSVRGADPDELSGYWDRLSDGATVVVPLAAAQWSPLYGMLEDRFGVTWVLDLEVAGNA
jgi:PhnB protein